MSQYLDILTHGLGTSIVPLGVMMMAAIAMAVCRHAATLRLKRGFPANWQKGGFNFFAVVLAISGAIMVYDRVDLSSRQREEAAAAEEHRQLTNVQSRGMQQSISIMTRQGQGFQIDHPRTSDNSTAGQAIR
jgi:hypothetical protein